VAIDIGRNGGEKISSACGSSAALLYLIG